MENGPFLDDEMSNRIANSEASSFDPYHKWLGIPPNQRPPTFYQLLGLSPSEQDLDVIHAAVIRQSTYVRNFQAGPHGLEATRILNEIAEARAVLSDLEKRRKYDAELAVRQEIGPASVVGRKQVKRVLRGKGKQHDTSDSVSKERKRYAVASGIALLAATSLLASMWLFDRNRDSVVEPEPIPSATEPFESDVIEHHPAKTRPTQAKRSEQELEFTVKPAGAEANVTVVSGKAIVTGVGISRRLTLTARDPGQEVLVRVDAAGYEATNHIFRIGEHGLNSSRTIELTPSRKWLADLTPEVWKGYLPLNTIRDHSIGVQPLNPAFGDYAVASYEIDEYRTFHFRAGLRHDSEEDSASPMRFAIFGDGRLLWVSDKLQQRGDTDDCVCDVTGVRRLELRVRCTGGNGYAWGIWIDPYLVQCDDFIELARLEREKQSFPDHLKSLSYWESKPTPTEPARTSPRSQKRSVSRQAVHQMRRIRNGIPVDWVTANKVGAKTLQNHGWEHNGLLGYASGEPLPGTVELRRLPPNRKKRHHSYVLADPKTSKYKDFPLHGWVWKSGRPGLLKFYALKNPLGAWQLTSDQKRREWLTKRQRCREMFVFYMYPPD